MIRLGIVNYLNNRPVYHFLLENGLPAGVDAVWGTPAEINAGLIRGDVDMGPISSIEYARHRRLFEIVPGIGIAAKGEVGSVLLFMNGKPEHARRIAVDRASATSVILLRLIMRHKYGTQPLLMPMQADLDRMLARCDGALVIGDAALTAKRRGELVTLDLAAEWFNMTGLPFVFALWVARKDASARRGEQVLRLMSTLHQSLDQGLAALDEIARSTEDLAYLEGLRYRLEEDDNRGMELFVEMATRREGTLWTR